MPLGGPFAGRQRWSDNGLVFLGSGLSKLELIFTLEHGLGPRREAEASNRRLTAIYKVTAPPETQTPVTSCNTKSNVSSEEVVES